MHPRGKFALDSHEEYWVSPVKMIPILGTLSINDESDDEDEPEVILTDKTILRM